MIKTIKVMLNPNNKQATKLKESAGVARFAYNFALNREKENHENGGKFLTERELRKELTVLKEKEEYKWLNDYSNNIPKQAIKDACNAYIRFFKKQTGFPRYKGKRKSKPSFYVDTDKIQFTGTHIKLEKLTTSRKSNKQKLNHIRLSEKSRIPVDSKYVNPRVTFDGLNWYISVGIEVENNKEIPQNNGLGVDLGLKNLAICSDNPNPFKNINKTKEIRKLKKKKRRLQRQVSKKYLKNKKGGSYCKTSNIIKIEKNILKLNHRLTNIRHNYLHEVTTEIINRKPKFIVLEDLNVKGMMKNKNLAEKIQEQCFYEFYRQIKYKAKWNNIEFIEAPRFYPSSKKCSNCGSIKKDLKLSDRVYVCEYCHSVIDRDYQAAINLYNYGKSIAF